MITVELIHDHDCPNAEETRRQIRLALELMGLPNRWTEWVRDEPGAEDRVRRYGSPTVLVNGHDVAGASPSDGLATCRLYGEGGKGSGFPSADLIAAALRRAAGEDS